MTDRIESGILLISLMISALCVATKLESSPCVSPRRKYDIEYNRTDSTDNLMILHENLYHQAGLRPS